MEYVKLVIETVSNGYVMTTYRQLEEGVGHHVVDVSVYPTRGQLLMRLDAELPEC